MAPRVQAVGPEHFGVLCFDCAKDRSKFMLANFYSAVLLPPEVVPHTRGQLQDVVARVRQAMIDHQLRDPTARCIAAPIHGPFREAV